MSSAEKMLKFGCWQKLHVSGATPPRRFAHSSVVVGDAMYVFGGSSYGEKEDTVYHNDMYTLKCKAEYSLMAYNPCFMRALYATVGENLTWKKIEQRGDVPSRREGAILM